MKRLLLVVLATAALAAPSLAQAASPAQIDCNTPVVDQAGVLSADQRLQAETATTHLESVGADPRVVFIDTFKPLASIDAFEQALIKRCPTWQSLDHLRKNNLVDVIVAMKDRKAVIGWGERWNQTLAGQADGLRADYLNPNLADGQYGVAVKQTLGEIGTQLSAQLHPKPTKPAGPTTVINNNKPTDLTFLWILLSALGGIALLVGLFFAGRSFSRARHARAAAQQEALKARVAAENAMLPMTQAHDDLERSVELAKGTLGPNEVKELTASFEKASDLVGKTSAAYEALDVTESDPSKKHPLEAYQQIGQGYDDVTAGATAAMDAIKASQAQADEFAALQKQVPGELERSKTDLPKGTDAVKKVAAEGYQTGPFEETLAKAGKLQEKAAAALGRKEAKEASEAVKAADAAIQEAVAGAEGLSKRRAQLEADVKTLSARIPKTEQTIAAVKPVFEAISKDYAEDSWTAVRGNGSDAEKRVAFAKEAVEHAEKSCTMDVQKWDDSQSALDQGNKVLDDAEALCAAIVSLKAALLEAKANAGKEISAAEADIEQAAAYEQQFDADIRDDLKSDIASARKLLAQSQAELKKAKPNYLEVVRLAQAANSAADAALSECQSEHEQMERLRRQAASAVSSAQSEISQAESYISGHSSDAGYSSRSSLDSAKSSLAQAQATDDLEQKISYAQSAESEASSAYSQAQSAVSEAEAEERRRRDAAAAAASASYSSSSSSMSFGGGGGGSSSGSFGGGGGGSSSGGW
jgi:uncharacterized membrane protein YgcG